MIKKVESPRTYVWFMCNYEINEFIIDRPLSMFEFEALQRVDGMMHRSNSTVALRIAHSLFILNINCRYDSVRDLTDEEISRMTEDSKNEYMFSRLCPVDMRGTLVGYGVARNRGNLAQNLGAFDAVYRFNSLE